MLYSDVGFFLSVTKKKQAQEEFYVKTALSKYVPGSAEYILEHAVLQQQRGKKASMPYEGEPNPRKALLIAQAELRLYMSLLTFRNYIVMLRQGTVHYQGIMRRIKREMRMGSFTLSEIGTSNKEFKRLYAKNVRLAAMHWLDALRCGTPEPQKTLRFLREDLAHGHLTPENIGTDENELVILSADISFAQQDIAQA